MSNCDCCGQKTASKVSRKPNYQKLVDVAQPTYGTILGKRLAEDGVAKGNAERRQRPTPCAAGGTDRSGKVHFAQPMPCKKFAPETYWQDPCDKKETSANRDNDKIVVCLPCEDNKPCPSKKVENPRPVANFRVYLPADKPKSPPKPKQKDYMYRCESRELLASKMLAYCECVKRNGLQDQCPRTPCRGRPACLVKPWPDCWPSGGCYGIDYDRQNGLQRVNPALEYRRDNKECKPPVDKPQQFTVTLEQYDV